ncbi:MAG TPA: DPP IV N-terminal domain-containing protein [Gemmatimonadales bacterium]|nr:DPP IV N-terminal domain-containing protein [Gemmatimonadales bacterium]
MTRLALGLTIMLALGLRPAAAQVVDFQIPGGDSALIILTGARATVDLRVTGGARAYDITLFLDDARVRLVQADSVPGYGLPKPTVTPGTGVVTIAASGTGYSSTTLIARLIFEMDSLAQQGTLISLRVNSLTNYSGVEVVGSHLTGLLNVCQALVLRGDVTGDRVISSRDALITLTAAVGLPVPGFQVMPGGDIDLDRAATSRDALFMLSLGIGLYTGYEGNIKGIANACAPLHPSPGDMLFFRASDIYGIAAGDTIPRRYNTPQAYNAYPARWSPDRRRILYTAYTPSFYYDLLAYDTLTGLVDTLVRNGSYDVGADWSPDGTRIAFVSQRVYPYPLYVMNANGTGQVQVTTGVVLNTGQPVSWSPDGTRIAFVACQTCGGYGIWMVGPDGSGLTEVLQGSLNHNPYNPVWTAAGDSIYYRRGDGYVWSVAAQAAATPVRVSPLYGGTESDSPGASSLGAVFKSYVRSPYDFFLRRSSDGRHLRVHRNTVNSNDSRPSFRRSGGVYVDTVTIAPDSASLSLSGTTTQQFTATVKNNDGSTSSAAVRWISRNPARVTVDSLGGLATAVSVDTAGVFIVATVRGWRSDSARVRVTP